MISVPPGQTELLTNNSKIWKLFLEFQNSEIWKFQNLNLEFQIFLILKYCNFRILEFPTFEIPAFSNFFLILEFLKSRCCAELQAQLS